MARFFTPRIAVLLYHAFNHHPTGVQRHAAQGIEQDRFNGWNTPYDPNQLCTRDDPAC